MKALNYRLLWAFRSVLTRFAPKEFQLFGIDRLEQKPTDLLVMLILI